MIYHCHIKNAYPGSIAMKLPLGGAARNFLRNGYKKAKPHTTPSHKFFIWNALLLNVLKDLPDTLFWHKFYQLFPITFLRLPDSVGILTLQNFFFAALSDSKLNLSSPFCYAYSDLCNFFTPLKYLLLIYSQDSPGCVSNHFRLFIH